MSIESGAARIPISGVISMNIPQWAKDMGYPYTDLYDIEEEVGQALANPAVDLIALDIDSPGGLSTASNSLFDLMQNAASRKPVMSYTRGLMCSAGYHAAAPSLAVYGNKCCTVGGIGSICVMLDDSKFLDRLGISREIFASGKYKATGLRPLDDDERQQIQSSVDRFGARFRSNVSKYRTSISSADMQGQTFIGEDAAARGFLSGIAGSFPEAVSRFRALL
jgi:signal peptide peptidase SppA